MKEPDQNSDWSRARGLLADLKSATRRSLTAQILLGKELRFLKTKLGFAGGGRRKELTQRALIVRNWPQWCESELGISHDTAGRYIACFEYALSRAKARKKAEPEACRLLQMPSAELNGEELETLAGLVAVMVEDDRGRQAPLTQYQILIELGIVKPRLLPANKNPQRPDDDPAAKGALWEQRFFEDFTEASHELAKAVGDLRKLMEGRPVTAGDTDESITLEKIRDGLMALNAPVTAALADVESRIAEKLGTAARPAGTAKRK